MPTTNNAGVVLIEKFEGCRLAAYQDSVGVWTIGFGHTNGVHAGMTITQAQAEAFLHADLHEAEHAVARLVKVQLTTNQFAALVSFTFNLGAGALSHSTLLAKINTGQFPEAANEFLKWDHAGGEELPGLKRRREAERALFLTP